MALSNQGDEEEGSHREMGIGRIKMRLKIERSAEALRVCHHPTTFPSKENFATRRASNRMSKKQRSGVELVTGSI
jgi:hypothetical protein